MHSTSAVAVLLCVLAAPAAAQDLEGRIAPGDTIYVTDRQGQETSGRLTSLSPDTLRVLTRGGERQILRVDIGRIEKPDPLWNGILIGGAIGAFTFSGAAGASCSPHCAGPVLLGGLAGGALFGYIGALIDRAIPGRTLVYGIAPNSSFVLTPTAPIQSTSDLWAKLRDGDKVRILENTGLETEGKFAGSSASSITIVDGGQRREIPVQRVKEVTRRGSYIGLGTLAGAALGVTTALINVCQDGTGRPEYVGCPFAGAALGAFVGWLIPRHVVVYRSGTGGGTTSAWVPRVLPIITPSTKAVMLTFSRREGR